MKASTFLRSSACPGSSSASASSSASKASSSLAAGWLFAASVLPLPPLPLVGLLVVVLADVLRFLDEGADGEDLGVVVEPVARDAALVVPAAPLRNLRLAPL